MLPWRGQAATKAAMQTAIKCLNTDGCSQGEKGAHTTFCSWLSGGEREILYEVYMAARTVCQQERQAPRKALPEREGGKAEQCRVVAELAALLEGELS